MRVVIALAIAGHARCRDLRSFPVNPASPFADSDITDEPTINLKTVKAIGVTVRLPLIGRADELIE